jgi:four helix bundle protein
MSIARTFRDLRAYQLARRAAGEVFRASKLFPKEERFSLTDQIRRSSRAVKGMIAEAWGRRRYVAVFVSEFDEAIGEATEVQSWLDDAFDSEYITREQFAHMNADWEATAAMLSRMIDRADDFCKNAPNADYRVHEEGEPTSGDLAEIAVENRDV